MSGTVVYVSNADSGEISVLALDEARGRVAQHRAGLVVARIGVDDVHAHSPSTCLASTSCWISLLPPAIV